MKSWKWIESSVDRSSDHISITYGKLTGDKLDHVTTVALVGPPSGNVFPVQFLFSGTTPDEMEMISNVKKELDFFLVEKKEKDPWAYALYHCSTTSNIYSSVHWNNNNINQWQIISDASTNDDSDKLLFKPFSSVKKKIIKTK